MMEQFENLTAFEPFGVRLRRLRIKRGLTHANLAKASHITTAEVREMERSGDHDHRDFQVGLMLAEALDADASYLCFGLPGRQARLIAEINRQVTDLVERVHALERPAEEGEH